jgi:hypothetical protein
MAADLTAMKARIKRELGNRTDLDTDIADAISTAIVEYQGKRFRFSDVIPDNPPLFDTVGGTWIYTSADNANISTTFRIDYVLAQIGNYLQPLEKLPPERIRIYNQLGQMRGQPLWYGYEGNELLIAPVPDQAYHLTLGLFRNVLAPLTDGEANNPWMIDGELLIRSRAKYEVALHKTRNTAMQEAMSPVEPPPGQRTGHAAYWAEQALKVKGNRVTSLGRIKPMAF